MDRPIVLLPILLATPALAFAVGSTFEMASRKVVISLDTDARYDRYTETSFGALTLFKDPLFDNQGNYLVAPGETWTWRWERLDQPQLVAEFTLTYIGGENGCWSDGDCEPIAGYYQGLKWPCMPEGEYRISMTHNGAPLGSGDFRPTRFRPVVNDLWHTDSLKPAPSAKEEGEITDYYVTVSDDLQCGQPLQDVEVTVKSDVDKDDLSHEHLRNDYGTGKFLPSPGFDASVTSAPPKINGRTNHDGLFMAKYQAGEHGVLETLITQLKRPATDTDPEILGPHHESSLHIKVPDLVEMTDEIAPVVFADGETCDHKPRPHWLTKNSRSRLYVISEIYHYRTGRKLSLNDASVAYGGVIDNKLPAGGRDAACHVSHRLGNDIDLNKMDSGGVDTLESPVTSGEKTPLIVDWLTRLVSKFGGERMPEATIHFRFPD